MESYACTCAPLKINFDSFILMNGKLQHENKWRSFEVIPFHKLMTSNTMNMIMEKTSTSVWDSMHNLLLVNNPLIACITYLCIARGQIQRAWSTACSPSFQFPYGSTHMLLSPWLQVWIIEQMYGFSVRYRCGFGTPVETCRKIAAGRYWSWAMGQIRSQSHLPKWMRVKRKLPLEGAAKSRNLLHPWLHRDHASFQPKPWRHPASVRGVEGGPACQS